MENKEINKWFSENSHISQSLGANIIPLHPIIGSYVKVNNLNISEDIFKQEFDIITKAYFSVMKKLEKHYINNKVNEVRKEKLKTILNK